MVKTMLDFKCAHLLYMFSCTWDIISRSKDHLLYIGLIAWCDIFIGQLLRHLKSHNEAYQQLSKSILHILQLRNVRMLYEELQD